MPFGDAQIKAPTIKRVGTVSRDPLRVNIDFRGPYANRGFKHIEIERSGQSSFVCTDADFLGKQLRNRPTKVEPAAARLAWGKVAGAVDLDSAGTAYTQSPNHLYGDLSMTAVFSDGEYGRALQGPQALAAFDLVCKEICACAHASYRPIAGLWSIGSPTMFFNPHPKQYAVGDCVKRTLVKITQLSYVEVSSGLNAIKRGLRARSFNSKKVTDWLIREAGIAKLTFGTGSLDESVSCFAASHDGVWIVAPKRHWLALVDHVPYDSWDSANEVVEKAYRVDNPDKLGAILKTAGEKDWQLGDACV